VRDGQELEVIAKDLGSGRRIFLTNDDILKERPFI
jgi:hypothetical protein